MSRLGLIVLKFGGSVLADRDSAWLAVHEIYRWRRQGYGVVAVVSAFASVTDALLGTVGDPFADPHLIAAVLGQGEAQAAGHLGALLDRSGVPCWVASPGALRLQATGAPLDGVPSTVEVGRLRGAISRDEVVVVPGFVAEDAEGRAMTLGRGGSDLTALWLAHALGAERCRLIKDVDGLYDRDPKSPGTRPARRFATASWEDALATDGSIVQHKALRWARDHGMDVELGGLNGSDPTRIGGGPSSLSVPRSPPRALRVLLGGLGTVNGGVLELLRQFPQRFEVVGAVVAHPGRARVGVDFPLFSDPPESILSRADLLIEAIGGTTVAHALIRRAIALGVPVISANKEVLARCRFEAPIGASAAVGGALPVLERIAAIGPDRIVSVRGVLNGTTNFVLDQVQQGMTWDEALAQARQLGFAESDATSDLSGLDAAYKLCLIGRALGRADADWGRIPRQSLDRGGCMQTNAVVRQVATFCPGDTASVALVPLGETDPLAKVSGAHNAVQFELDDGSTQLIRGKGAGRWPTAVSVMGDVLTACRAPAA